MARALGEEGPLSGKELKERVESADGPVVGTSFIHLMFLAAIEGILVRGPMQGKQQAYVLAEDWLGPWQAPDRDAALAELARRYLVGNGPADERDLARWSGLPLRDARAGLAAIASRLVERDDGLVDLAKLERSTELPPPRLLGAYEPLLLGWTSREEMLETALPTGSLTISRFTSRRMRNCPSLSLLNTSSFCVRSA